MENHPPTLSRTYWTFQALCEQGSEPGNVSTRLFDSKWNQAEREAVLQIGYELIDLGLTPARSFAIVRDIYGMARTHMK